MEPINLADAKSNSLAPSNPFGKMGKGAASQTALFDRLMATVAPVGDMVASPETQTLGAALTTPMLTGDADPDASPDMPDILTMLEVQNTEVEPEFLTHEQQLEAAIAGDIDAEIDPALFVRDAANQNAPVKIVAENAVPVETEVSDTELVQTVQPDQPVQKDIGPYERMYK